MGTGKTIISSGETEQRFPVDKIKEKPQWISDETLKIANNR